MEQFEKLLSDETSYKLSDELMNRLMTDMTEVCLKEGEVLIPYGRTDSHIYVVKSGIVRYCYFDGDKEKTFGFATPGTMMLSYHSYVMNEPSFFQLEACNKAAVMKIPKPEFDRLLEQSNEFSRWMLSLSLGQLYYNEKKFFVVNGLAKERFRSLVRNRPEIIRGVSQKIIASYLGVTPNYLSKLKNVYFKEIF